MAVETTEYMPFGGIRKHTGTGVSNYKFTDQELDPESGLYNYDARMYDPMIGRFITADTIVPRPFDPQSLNRYSYALNNPLIYVDPTGHEPNEDSGDWGDYSDAEGNWGSSSGGGWDGSESNNNLGELSVEKEIITDTFPNRLFGTNKFPLTKTTISYDDYVDGQKSWSTTLYGSDANDAFNAILGVVYGLNDKDWGKVGFGTLHAFKAVMSAGVAFGTVAGTAILTENPYLTGIIFVEMLPVWGAAYLEGVHAYRNLYEGLKDTKESPCMACNRYVEDEHL